MSELPRRRLLAVAGTGVTAAVAGCSSSDDEDEANGDEDDDPEATETESSTDVEGTILGEITINNSDSVPHTVDVIVEFDREIEAWETRSLEGNEDVTLDRAWPTDSGQFRVTARLDQEELTEVTPAKWNDPDCLNLIVRINSDGELLLPGMTDGGPCGSGDVDPDDAE